MGKVLKIISAFILIISFKSSYGQYYYYNDSYFDKDVIVEAGGSFGLMVAATDVGRKEFSPFLPANYDWKSAKTNGGIYVGFLYQNFIGARIEYTMGSIAGADSSSNNAFYKKRNLSFRSSINEISALAEFHPVPLLFVRDEPYRLSPYILAGVGYFTYNPQALFKGNWVDLQPLHTEGQGFKEYPDRTEYRLHAVSVPVGVGVKYELSSLFNIRTEVVYRRTTTDYLDDVSTTYISRPLFYQYLSPKFAAMADALANRYKEKSPTTNYPGGTVRGTTDPKNDGFFTFNIKLGMTFGRQPRF